MGGFVSKQKTEKLLETKQPGCFLLRFSDSKLGGVTMGFKRQMKPHVQHIAPLTSRGLYSESIRRIVIDNKDKLTFLYPDIPLVEFEKASSISIDRNEAGYLAIKVQAHITGYKKISRCPNPWPGRLQDTERALIVTEIPRLDDLPAGPLGVRAGSSSHHGGDVTGSGGCIHSYFCTQGEAEKISII